MLCGNKCHSDSRRMKFLKFIPRTRRIWWNMRKILKNRMVSNTELRGGQSSLTEYIGETKE